MITDEYQAPICSSVKFLEGPCRNTDGPNEGQSMVDLKGYYVSIEAIQVLLLNITS